MRVRLGWLFGCSISLLLISARTKATTFVLQDESELAAQSVAVVTGTVSGIEAAANDATGGVQTYVHLTPSAIVAGSLPAGELVLREAGGELPGRSERLYGSPQYHVGERVLVFVSQNVDGTLRTTSMAMGKYTLHAGRRQRLVRRSYGSGVTVLDRHTGHVETNPQPETLELDEVIARIARRGPSASSAYGPAIVMQPAELTQRVRQQQLSAFTFLGTPARWFEPDAGQVVAFQIDRTGDMAIGPADSRMALNQAFAAWSTVAGTNLQLGDGGLMDPMPLAGCGGGSRLIFNDPYNEVTDPVNCGGVLAVGSYCSSWETTEVSGTTFHKIVTGKVMFNNGWENCPFWTTCNLAEVATHELGHAIGLGHATDSSATMAATAHFDGRCAGLGSDDIAAVTFMYPDRAPAVIAATPTPTPVTSSSGATSSTPTPTATALVVRTPTPAGARFATRTTTSIPTRTPTRGSIRRPTRTPTRRPTRTPTRRPTRTPTRRPTRTPTAPADTAPGLAVDQNAITAFINSLAHLIRQSVRP